MPSHTLHIYGATGCCSVNWSMTGEYNREKTSLQLVVFQCEDLQLAVFQCEDSMQMLQLSIFNSKLKVIILC